MGVPVAGSLVSFVELVGWSMVWSEADHWVCLFWGLLGWAPGQTKVIVVCAGLEARGTGYAENGGWLRIEAGCD